MPKNFELSYRFAFHVSSKTINFWNQTLNFKSIAVKFLCCQIFHLVFTYNILVTLPFFSNQPLLNVENSFIFYFTWSFKCLQRASLSERLIEKIHLQGEI